MWLLASLKGGVVYFYSPRASLIIFQYSFACHNGLALYVYVYMYMYVHVYVYVLVLVPG